MLTKMNVSDQICLIGQVEYANLDKKRTKYPHNDLRTPNLTLPMFKQSLRNINKAYDRKITHAKR